jgi:hypothetical protein
MTRVVWVIGAAFYGLAVTGATAVAIGVLLVLAGWRGVSY